MYNPDLISLSNGFLGSIQSEMNEAILVSDLFDEKTKQSVLFIIHRDIVCAGMYISDDWDILYARM